MRTLLTASLAIVVALAAARSLAQEVLPDLTSPEATIRSFLNAVFAGEIRAAAQCVEGAGANPGLANLERAAKSRKDRPTVLKPKSVAVTVKGDEADADLQYEKVTPDIAPTEKVHLQRTRADWRIVASTAALGGNRNGRMPLIGSLVILLGGHSDAILASRESARGVYCLSNLKQIALGAMMYTQDSDEVFKLREDAWKSRIMPYIKNEAIFHCPADKSGAVSYSFNPYLAGLPLAKISSPAETVMIYEGHKRKLDFRHNGKAGVAFADGHAKMIDAETAKKLRWKP